jgi:hypothetical protein
MHDMTDRDVRELHEHQERRRALNLLIADHRCIQCYVGFPCEWMRETTKKRDEYDREVKRIARLVGITEPI